MSSCMRIKKGKEKEEGEHMLLRTPTFFSLMAPFSLYALCYLSNKHPKHETLAWEWIKRVVVMVDLMNYDEYSSSSLSQKLKISKSISNLKKSNTNPNWNTMLNTNPKAKIKNNILSTQIETCNWWTLSQKFQKLTHVGIN